MRYYSVTVHRRTLHRIPELHDQLPETLRYVRSVLEPLGLHPHQPHAWQSLRLFRRRTAGDHSLPVDLLLSVTETTGRTHPPPSIPDVCTPAATTGTLPATALALAEFVSAQRSALPRNVLFLFQPAEETTGGARALCESGILHEHRVTRIFGRPLAGASRRRRVARTPHGPGQRGDGHHHRKERPPEPGRSGTGRPGRRGGISPASRTGGTPPPSPGSPVREDGLRYGPQRRQRQHRAGGKPPDLSGRRSSASARRNW